MVRDKFQIEYNLESEGRVKYLVCAFIKATNGIDW